VPSWGTGVTSQPAAEISASGRDESVVRHPPVSPRTPLLGANSIPLHGANSSSIPAEGGLGRLASGAGRLHLVKTKLYGCTKQKLKKGRANQAETRACLSGEKSQPGPFKRPRPAGSTSTERVRPLKRPRTYKETLTNFKTNIVT
jgi:hypothetical protein